MMDVTLPRTLARVLFAALAAGCASAPPQAVAPASDEPRSLARFMRENLNVPFSFAMMATATKRPHRVHMAASVLREAAYHLADWPDPPAVSMQGRDVFYAYATNLAYHVRRLERATAGHDAPQVAYSLERIRQTCNSCHSFFRPASRFSPDVYVDYSVHGRVAVELPGGTR
jgi:cytochrome c556